MKIIIVGKGGSGKNFLQQKFIERGFKPSISHTTRTKRDDEREGEHYHFVSENLFKAYLMEENFQETDCFNNWWYGTTNAEWHRAEVFIKTPSGVSKIKPEERKNCFVIYLDIRHNIRHERLSLRNDADKVERRMKEDKKQFEGFVDFDIRITNHDF